MLFMQSFRIAKKLTIGILKKINNKIQTDYFNQTRTV